jgi:hypothetical protein
LRAEAARDELVVAPDVDDCRLEGDEVVGQVGAPYDRVRRARKVAADHAEIADRGTGQPVPSDP